MGQANAARDSLYDLRECKMTGTDASGFDISGALLADGDFSQTKFVESQFSKAYSPGAKYDGADFTNAVVDRVTFVWKVIWLGKLQSELFFFIILAELCFGIVEV